MAVVAQQDAVFLSEPPFCILDNKTVCRAFSNILQFVRVMQPGESFPDFIVGIFFGRQGDPDQQIRIADS